MGQREVEGWRGQDGGGGVEGHVGVGGALPISLTPGQLLSSCRYVDDFIIQDLIARTSKLRNIYIVLPQDFYRHHQKYLFHPW